MPGPIDLEPDHPWHESVERVEIANNTMIGWDGCFTQGGIGVSNHEHADVMVQDVLIRDNKISGCFQRGITIIGSGRDGHPIVVRDNTLQTTRPNPRIPGRWEIGVAGRILEGVHRPSYADIRANKIIGDGTLDGIESDGTDMIGLYVRASKTMFAGNCIEGAHKLGVDFDEHYEDAPAVSFTGQNVFCGNLLRRNGTDPAMSAMALSGICHQVRSNLFEASPRGVEVRSGTENEFFTNSFDACDVSPCVHCAGTPNVGCQNFAGPDQLTNCVSCPPNSGCLPSGGGGGDDPIAIDP
jgi:hypothetical protein